MNGKMKLVAHHPVAQIKSGKVARNPARTKKFVSNQIQLLDVLNSSKIDQCAFVSQDLFSTSPDSVSLRTSAVVNLIME